MTLADFLDTLINELRYRGEPFHRGELETFAADVWVLAQEDTDPARWASEYLAARQPA
jgi:hypothetical protein